MPKDDSEMHQSSGMMASSLKQNTKNIRHINISIKYLEFFISAKNLICSRVWLACQQKILWNFKIFTLKLLSFLSKLTICVIILTDQITSQKSGCWKKTFKQKKESHLLKRDCFADIFWIDQRIEYKMIFPIQFPKKIFYFLKKKE